MATDQVLHLEGNIHEEYVFPTIAESIKNLTINLEKVKSINSVGIREWINWIGPLSRRVAIVLTSCPKPIVQQINMIDGFLPVGVKVASFLVPFHCSRCDEAKSFLFEVGKQVVVEKGQYQVKVDVDAMAKCQDPICEMEMYVSPGKYFQFLNRQT